MAFEELPYESIDGHERVVVINNFPYILDEGMGMFRVLIGPKYAYFIQDQSLSIVRLTWINEECVEVIFMARKEGGY